MNKILIQPAGTKPNKKILTSRVPILFKQVQDLDLAIEKWDVNYLQESLPNNNAEFYSYNKNHHFNREKISNINLNEAFKKLSDNRYPDISYIARQPIQKDMKINADLATLKFVQEHIYHAKNLWVGSSLSMTPLHFDSTDGLLYQIQGKKKIILFSPEDTYYLYPHHPFSNGRFNLSEISYVHNVDLEKFPNFFNTEQYSITLEPGDVLYIPKGWWHMVYNLTFSIAINFFFTNQLKGNYSKEHLLIYQATRLNKDYPAKLYQLLNESHYKNCLNISNELLVMDSLSYAILFIGAYLEEFIKHKLRKHHDTMNLSNHVFLEKLLYINSPLVESTKQYYECLLELVNNSEELLSIIAHEELDLNELFSIMKLALKVENIRIEKNYIDELTKKIIRVAKNE